MPTTAFYTPGGAGAGVTGNTWSTPYGAVAQSLTPAAATPAPALKTVLTADEYRGLLAKGFQPDDIQSSYSPSALWNLFGSAEGKALLKETKVVAGQNKKDTKLHGKWMKLVTGATKAADTWASGGGGKVDAAAAGQQAFGTTDEGYVSPFSNQAKKPRDFMAGFDKEITDFNYNSPGSVYNKYLGGYGQAGADWGKYSGNLLASMDEMGAQEKRDIGTRAGAMNAGMQQHLTSQGLGGTTIGATMAAGGANQANSEYGRLAERLLQAKTGMSADLARTGLGFQQSGLAGLQAYMQSLQDKEPGFNYMLGQQSATLKKQEQNKKDGLLDYVNAGMGLAGKAGSLYTGFTK